MEQASVDWPQVGKFLDFLPQKFVLVNSKDNPKLLLKMLQDSHFPNKAEVFTHEMSLAGAAFDSCSRDTIRKRMMWRASDLKHLFEPFKRIIQEKNLKVWFGHPLWEEEKLYNAYSLFDGERMLFVQRKRFLYEDRTDPLLSDTWLFSRPDKWQGKFKNYSILICSEASAFYSPLARSKPTKIPELREAGLSLVVIPAYWMKNKYYLRQTAQVVARQYSREKKGGFIYEKGIRKKVALVFVVNYNSCYVVGPIHWPDRPERVTNTFAELKKPGWIFVSPQAISVKEI